MSLIRRDLIAGVVMDTCHSLVPAQGLPALITSPGDFVSRCDSLLQNNVPWMMHLQPSRIPQGGRYLVTSNLLEVFSFIRGVAGNPLSEMVSVMKGVDNVPIIIELDPKFGFFFRHRGMVWLLRKMKEAILRDVT